MLLEGIMADNYRYRQGKIPSRKATQRSYQDLVIETQKLLINDLPKRCTYLLIIFPACFAK